MPDKMMDTPTTAWRNMRYLSNFFNAAEVETYGAVYIQAYEGRTSKAMRAAGERAPCIAFALEDADIDRTHNQENS